MLWRSAKPICHQVNKLKVVSGADCKVILWSRATGVKLGFCTVINEVY